MRKLAVWLLLASLPLGAVLTPDQQHRSDRLAAEFVAPCCWQEALSNHRSPAAEQARAELAALVEQGKSDGEIREAFVAEYGERILIVPEGGKADLLFWTPVVFLILAGTGAAWVLMRMRRRTQLQPAADGPLAEVDESEVDW